MNRHAYAVGLTASCLLVALPAAEASAFGFDWLLPERRLEPSVASERASLRAVAVDATRAAGSEDATFVVRFRSRARLGPYEGRKRVYMVVMRSSKTVACINRRDWYAERGRRGSALVARLQPRGKGGRWCTGPYRGRVYYVDTLSCPTAGPCSKPDGFTSLRRLVGRFSLRVD